jgi:hypothetical protein
MYLKGMSRISEPLAPSIKAVSDVTDSTAISSASFALRVVVIARAKRLGFCSVEM